MLKGKTAIVTGGSSGIGRAIAILFAENGADVVVADITEEPKEKKNPTQEVINNIEGGNAKFVECDVGDPDSHDSIISAAEKFGDINILVNNAGIVNADDYLQEKEDDYDEVMNVNLKGAHFLSQSVGDRMVTNNVEGAIVNISSMNGILGSGGYISYTASKGGLRTFTYSLADRLGPEGIRVNAIHPGSINTAIVDDSDEEAVERTNQLIPSRRMGEPEEVAKVALFLASDMSSYVNGESILVDGGYTNTGSPRSDTREEIN
jgi:NAD(P)-dependent dehydrogenase (short-subunit alcohol dehydrogenase family)